MNIDDSSVLNGTSQNDQLNISTENNQMSESMMIRFGQALDNDKAKDFEYPLQRLK